MADNELIWGVFTPVCFEIFSKFDVNDVIEQGCAALAISKLLGYGIIAGAALLKVPQIYRVISEQSGKGLSIISLAVESVGMATTAIYFYKQDYPVSTYGEAPLIVAQNLILFFLIFQFENQFTMTNVIGLILGVAYFALGMAGQIPFFVIERIFSSQFLIILGARVPQIYTVIQDKSTGALAMVTTFLQFAGTLARLFTTYQEIDDIMPLLQYVLSAFLNGLLFALFFVYPAKAGEAEKPSKGGSGKKGSSKNAGKKSKKAKKAD